MPTGAGSRAAALGSLLALALFAPLVARAQTPAGQPRLPMTWHECEIRAEERGTTPDRISPDCGSPFKMRGAGDFAGSGVRMQDPTVRMWVTNSGPGDAGLEMRGKGYPVNITGAVRNATTWRRLYWDLQWMVAVSRTDWVRNREIAPTLRNALGGGVAFNTNLDRLGGNVNRWQGADGSVGILHSGVQAEPTGCLDHGPNSTSSGRDWPYGMPLLAGSDCPETWGSIGWQGRRWIGPIENWIRYFDDAGANFTFDFWHVPQAYWQTAERPMTVSDNFQTYGAASDWGAEVRRIYGNVIPGQTGDPTIESYPTGLTVKFQAYSFKSPAVSGGLIMEALVINESEKVYGVPLDYDSLWFGHWGQDEDNNTHVIPELGVALATTNTGIDPVGGSPGCSTYLKAVPGLGGCSTNTTQRGFRSGGVVLQILKSPIGDLRNKHFSNPASPFYAPNHPNAGDTITFTRAGQCSWHCTTANVVSGNRAMYGTMVADPVAALNGRDPRTSFSDVEYRRLFGVYFDDDGVSRVFCNPSTPRAMGCFGWVVPGTDNYVETIRGEPTPTWTYTNRPPGAPIGPDTLFIDNCRPPTSNHPHRNRCTGLWSDSTYDGSVQFSDDATYVAAGPFPLKAGDTVPWVMAWYAGNREEQFMTFSPEGRKQPGPLIYDWYNFYVNDFYLGPSQPPPPGIVSVATQGGSSFFGGPKVTLFLDNAAEAWRDDYTLKFIADLRNPRPGTFASQIRAADPTAPDRLLAAIDKNLVDTVYIYKSCDLGRSATATAQVRCDPRPLYSASNQLLAGGWVSYARLVPDARGRFPKVWEDETVTGGVRYIYSMVSVTKGVQFQTRYRPLTGPPDRDTTLTIIQAGRTTFGWETGNPWVTEVYVPLMEQIGAETARLEITREEGPLRWANQGAVNFASNADRAGNYRLVFGRDAVVQEFKHDRTVDSTVILLKREALAVLPSGALQRLDLPDRRYVDRSPQHVALGGDTLMTHQVQALGGDRTLTTTTMNRKSGILIDANTGSPLFVSGLITSTLFTPGEFMAHPGFRQFTLGITDAAAAFTVARAGSRVGHAWEHQREAMRTTVWPSVVQQSDTAYFEHNNLRFGTWEFTFGARFYGRLNELPVFNIDNPQSTVDTYVALLQRRAAVSRTDVSEATVRAVRLAFNNPNLTAADLVDAKLPFTVTNREFGNSPVRVAMLKSNKRAMALLGFEQDTVSAPVPADVWIPGEFLILLEEVDLARTNADGTLMVTPDGEPQWTKEWRVTAKRFMLGCTTPDPHPRITCNPVTGPRGAGRPGYVDVRLPGEDAETPDGWTYRVTYRDMITSQSLFEFRVVPRRVGSEITRITQSMLDEVRVVPNPYIGVSTFDYIGETRRVAFTPLPPRGTINIFTASGQFVQRLDWEPEDLQGTGDLMWQLNTKEGTEVAAGFYIFILETTDPETGAKLSKPGKFVIIK